MPPTFKTIHKYGVEELLDRRADLQAQLARARAEHNSVIETYDWVKRGETTLGPVQHSVFHKVKDYVTSTYEGPSLDRWFGNGIEHQIFLVQHNWGDVFTGATDFAEGDFVLPYEHCAFEFIIAGRRVISIHNQDEAGERKSLLAVQCDDTEWFVGSEKLGVNNDPYNAALVDDLEKSWNRIMEVVWANVKAMCVALESEVVEESIIPAPFKLNAARAKLGRSALPDYRIVNLSRRHRHRPPADPDTGTERAGRRLHFRRGHWRHLSDKRIWVRWCLVGDPDLGFINKHYKL